MKRLNYLLILVAVLVMASCTSTDEKLRAMIPNDAVGVVKINMPSILDKAGIKKGEEKDATLTIPSDLKAVIDQANANIEDDLNIIGDVVNYLPESGIDVGCHSYVFLTKGVLQAVALLPLADEDKAKEVVNKIAHGKMKEMVGIEFASHLDYAFAIDDNVLLIARKNNATDDEASAAAKNILYVTYFAFVDSFHFGIFSLLRVFVFLDWRFVALIGVFSVINNCRFLLFLYDWLYDFQTNSEIVLANQGLCAFRSNFFHAFQTVDVFIWLETHTRKVTIVKNKTAIGNTVTAIYKAATDCDFFRYKISCSF